MKVLLTKSYRFYRLHVTQELSPRTIQVTLDPFTTRRGTFKEQEDEVINSMIDRIAAEYRERLIQAVMNARSRKPEQTWSNT